MTLSDRLDQAQSELRRLEADIRQALADRKDRSRAPLNRRLHELRRMLNPNYHYASQAGQDAIIDRYFQGKTGGTFIDVGGFDGVTGSNSVFFEAFRKWTGLLVEPVPSNLEKAQSVRRCPCLPYAVSDQDGAATFLEVQEGYTQMSGLVDSYDPDLLSQVRQDKRHKEATITVETRRLSTILRDHDLMHPDVISLDIEGGELACLQDFPFGDHDVQVWSIENNTGASDIPQIMRDNGYDLIEFAGPDDIFAKRR
ncbi:FkbM family methyltransferase [Nereida sp. MMG025]|uniref:FkbM family methyltransferase n=1 Tax=Nereida sp. MMG025 TaxID=2909981 RepID=UPI001F16AE19|nr:FkbM family methyltransferase [Nereida sp. MMG025]MCF6444721.1 FkbM family methyltransferase [Nereida sp. MMG025]